MKIILVMSAFFLFVVNFPFMIQHAYAKTEKADKVLILKEKRLLFLLREGEIMKVYKIALGKEPVGTKIKQGDNRTPEGSYILNARKQSDKYHLTIFISYPNDSDAQRARDLGVSPGGAIAIHGLPKELAHLDKLHRKTDWTQGCIAVTNNEIEEIWSLVEDGTPIVIKP